ncbi:MAG: cytochrome C [Candidatus Zixiibacteriota bacterium]|jgi:hypothetical protein
MRLANKLKVSPLILLIGLAILLSQKKADSIPSFARQTELTCNTCHYVFPELTAFGRQFKLNGYTYTNSEAIEETGSKAAASVKINRTMPLSAMVQASYVNVAETQPGTQNNNMEFPQQLSFFIAGEITPMMGTFIQITYEDQGGQFGWDNTDIRFAGQTNIKGKGLTYGVTLNNSPTVQDVWNSTPAWGFPYEGSELAPSPAAATIIEDAMAQEVIGLGAYGFFNNAIYGEFTGYRSTPQGGPLPPDGSSMNTVKGITPYWRVAVQRQFTDFYLEVGTYGLHTTQYPQGVSGLTDKYTDVAFDFQFERAIGNGNLIAHGTWIHEKQNLDAAYAIANAQNPSNKLNTFRADAGYSFWQNYVFTLAFFSVSGDKDTLLYSPGSLDGSRTGKPNSNGFVAELDVLPWQNTKFSVQYTLYNKFNGAGDNYDGFGRSAGDNNTLYMAAWMVF